MGQGKVWNGALSEGVHCSAANGVPADTPCEKFSRFYKSGFTKGTRPLHGQKGPARRGVSGGVQATAKPARPSTRSAARSSAGSTARSPLYAATEIPSPEPRYIPIEIMGHWDDGKKVVLCGVPGR